MTEEGYDKTFANIGQTMDAVLKFVDNTKNKYKRKRLIDKYTWFWKENKECWGTTKEDKMIGKIDKDTLHESMELGIITAKWIKEDR